MKLVLKLFLKELKNQKKLMAFFCFNICLALSTLLSLESVKSGVETLLYSKAKDLMGADTAIRARRKFETDEIHKFHTFYKNEEIKSSEVIETFSMIFAPKQEMSRLVEVKAVSSNYPLYGQIKLQNGVIDAATPFALKTSEIYISQDLRNLMGLEKGDFCKIGKMNFAVVDVVVDDSSSSWRGLDLAPKLYMNLSDLHATGLITKGSTLSHSLLLQFKPEAQNEEVYKRRQAEFYKEFSDNTINITIPRDASGQVSRVFDYLIDFLSLISLLALMLAVTGISFLLRGFINQKCKEVAVLKSLGFSNYQVRCYFILYILFLTLISFVISYGLSLFFLPLLQNYLMNYVPAIKLTLNFIVLSKILFIVLALNLMANLPFVFQLQNVREIILLREDGNTLSLPRPKLSSWLPLMFFFFLLCIWQANSIKIGLVFASSFLFCLILLWGFFSKLLNLLANLNVRNFFYIFNFAIKRMARNKASSLTSLVALTIGLTLVVLITQLKSSLYEEFSVDNSEKRASLFIFDIQDEQLSFLDKHLTGMGHQMSPGAALIRARLLKINQEDVEAAQADDYETREAEASRRIRNRGINLSYRNELDASEEIIDGEILVPYEEGKMPYPGLSLEEKYAQRMGIKLGDILTFDIQGVELIGEVKNFRKVKWTSFKPNFFILVAPGVLELAPKTFIATLSQISDDKIWQIQNELAKNFPNISSIHVNHLLKKILSLFEQMSIGVTLMSFCCILVSLCVISSIFYYQMAEKKKDFSILKVLGMGHTSLKIYFILEYLLIVTFSSLFCLALGNIMGYIFLNQIFDLAFNIEWSQLFIILIVIYFFNFLISFLGIINILRTKPRNYLLN
ncbi:MAG: FtsX-like permease family protein [Bacteriovoracaceae bacterium]|nr:FtsX-like permease family protein [Bacteriovoracaceae bacterium]